MITWLVVRSTDALKLLAILAVGSARFGGGLLFLCKEKAPTKPIYRALALSLETASFQSVYIIF